MRGKGSKLGEPCPKVRLSQDRLPIEQAYFTQMPFAQMSLRANVTQPLMFAKAKAYLNEAPFRCFTLR